MNAKLSFDPLCILRLITITFQHQQALAQFGQTEGDEAVNPKLPHFVNVDSALSGPPPSQPAFENGEDTTMEDTMDDNSSSSAFIPASELDLGQSNWTWLGGHVYLLASFLAGDGAIVLNRRISHRIKTFEKVHSVLAITGVTFMSDFALNCGFSF